MVKKLISTEAITNSQQAAQPSTSVSLSDDYISKNYNFLIAKIANLSSDGKGPELYDSSCSALALENNSDILLRLLIVKGPKRKPYSAPFPTYSTLGRQKVSLCGRHLELNGDMFHPHFKVHGRHTDLAPKTLVMYDGECILTACDIKAVSDRGPHSIVIFVSNLRYNPICTVLKDFSEAKIQNQIISLLGDTETTWPLKQIKLIKAVKESIARAFAVRCWHEMSAESTELHIRVKTQERFYDKSKDKQTAIDKSMFAHLRDLQGKISIHQTSCDNFSRWLQSTTSPMSQVLREQIKTVLAKSGRLEQRYRDHFQLHVSAVSLEESGRALDQNRSLGRLTQLAFVFIPVTFTTGIFGMNVAPFVNGGAPMWKFWVTSVAIAISTLILWAMASPLERTFPKVWASLKKPEEQPLPSGWGEMKYRDRSYFINYNNDTFTWLDPRSSSR